MDITDDSYSVPMVCQAQEQEVDAISTQFCE